MSQQPLKSQQIFEQAPVGESAQTSSQQSDSQDTPLQQQILFDQAIDRTFEQAIETRFEQEALEPIVLSSAKSSAEKPAQKSTKSNRLFKWFSVALGTIIIIETGDFLISSWLNSPIMAALYTGALGLGLTLAGKTLIAELKQLRRLKQIKRWQSDCERMSQAEQIGQAKKMCQQISANLPKSNEQNLAIFEQSVKTDFNDDDIIHLYSDMVLAPIDEQAVKLISRHASETSLMVAISPMAVMDMALMMWRNFKMIEQICTIYGVELGYWSRIRQKRRLCRR